MHATSGTIEMNLTEGLSRWLRIGLLLMLAYEGLGGVAGGILLIAAPDGRYMDMPVGLMNGVFRDFLIPGILLLALGVLNLFAFLAVWRRQKNDWMMACLAMGGFTIWFVVEIIILNQLHWLHLMWGFPVFLGLVFTLPLVVRRTQSEKMISALLLCGALSSLWYVFINIMVPFYYRGYSVSDWTVSELSAIGTPTRVLWVLLALFYLILFMAFGWGIFLSAGNNRKLKATGIFTLVYCIVTFYWPPMHQREVIGSGLGTMTDTMHLVMASLALLFMMLLMGFAATTLGKSFRNFTFMTFVAFLLFGTLVGLQSKGIEANQPTPLLGIWERLNIGAFLLWVVVLSFLLYRQTAPLHGRRTAVS